MEYLLDTHTLLWFLEDDEQLPASVKKEIANTDNRCFVSIASIWEICIKVKLGKLVLKVPFAKLNDYLVENDIEILNISFNHLLQLTNLDLYHRDPFDRIIVAQGIFEGLVIMTKDSAFLSYNTPIFWKMN